MNLHGQIMNIQTPELLQFRGDDSPLLAYRVGHRDARHAAAELALAADAELAALRKDAERYRKLREAGSALKLYVYDDKDDPCSGDWHYKPSPEDVDAFADGLGAA